MSGSSAAPPAPKNQCSKPRLSTHNAQKNKKHINVFPTFVHLVYLHGVKKTRLVLTVVDPDDTEVAQRNPKQDITQTPAALRRSDDKG
jgi:hypothetical protein